MRYEFKYLVPSEQYQLLHSAMLPFLRRDGFAAKQETGMYTVRSIYFDTPGFEMYHTKIDGIAHRMKVRIRGYNVGDDNSTVFLEIKRKYEGPILKNRADAPFGVIKELFKPGVVFDDYVHLIKNPDNARRFFYQIHSKNLRPVINVIYEREPFLGKNMDLENDFRVTFDLHLRSVGYPEVENLYQETGASYAYPGFFILEVKFNHYCPTWVKPIMEDFQLRKEPASKYVGTINSNHFINPMKRGEALAKGQLKPLPNPTETITWENALALPVKP
ncbi:MAG: polyphosphate polymerase domain-containing protein [Saprospiraceae bacterium]|nr:polyphosphate polymerase domain-containing protein [Saprospiraceae bacterium]